MDGTACCPMDDTPLGEGDYLPLDYFSVTGIVSSLWVLGTVLATALLIVLFGIGLVVPVAQQSLLNGWIPKITKISSVLFVKNVEIRNEPVNEGVCFVALRTLDVEQIERAMKTESRIGIFGVDRSWSGKDALFRGSAAARRFDQELKISGQILAERNKLPTAPNADVFSGRLAKIIDNDGQFRTRHFERIGAVKGYIGAQLSLLSVARYPTLITAKDRSQYSAYRSDKGKYLSPILFFLGLAAFTIGYWRGVRGHWGITLWAPCILFGILAAVIGGIWSCIVFADHAAVSYGFGASAARYSRTEYVRVISVVVPELKLRDVQRHIFAADFVERADNTALHQRPETFNRVGVNGTDNVFLILMLDVGVRKFAAEFPVSHQIVSNQQTDFVGYGFADETRKCLAVETVNDASNDGTLALDRTKWVKDLRASLAA